MAAEDQQTVVKAGWVRKRSAYLRKWRSRWLVLTPTLLVAYKTQGEGKTVTMKVALRDIVEMELDAADTCLRLVTSSRIYFLSCPTDLPSWATAIQQTRSLPHRQHTEHLSLSRQHCEMSLFTFFNSLNFLMSERLNILIDTHTKAKLVTLETAKKAVSEFESAATNFETTFMRFQAIYRNTEIGLWEKLQLLKAFKPDNNVYKELDEVIESKPSVSLPLLLPVVLLNRGLKLEIVSNEERRVRRAPTTRALKWDYNGERIDALSFSASKDITLTGVGICRPYKPYGLLRTREVKVLVGLTTRSPVAYSGNADEYIDYIEGESVYRLHFHPAPQLRANSIYTLTLQLTGSNSFKCVDCSRILDTGAVTWTFMNTVFQEPDISNRSDEVCGPIADFYYMLST